MQKLMFKAKSVGCDLVKFQKRDPDITTPENKKEEIKNIIEKINKKLTLLEKIKRFQLIDENFSIENGLMTPTMKVKRKKVTEKYINELEKLY